MRRWAGASVLAAAALFGTTGTARELLVPEAGGASVGAVRLLVGALGLLVWVVLRGDGAGLVRLWKRPVVWVMAVGVAGYQAFFFIGTQNAGVAVGTLIALGSAPVLSGLLGWAVGEGAPGWVWAGVTAVAVTGLGLIVGTSLGGGAGIGMLAALGAGGSYAIYTVLGVRLARDGHRSGTILAASFALGAVALLPLAVGADWVGTAKGLGLILWLGIATTTVAYLLFGVGLAHLQPGHIATLTLFEPAVATLLGVFVLGQSIPAVAWLGVALVIAALALLGVVESRQPKADEPASETIAIKTS